MMTPAQRETLRLSLLTAFEAAKPYAVGLQALRIHLPEWRRVDNTALLAEIAYLVEKGLVAVKGKAISPEVTEWHITASGRDLLATEGLA